jgi:hypothetical protein
VCQPVEGLPPATASVEALIGTYFRQLPPVSVRFLTATGAIAASGAVTGRRQGYVVIPIIRASPAPITRACLSLGGARKIAVGGSSYPEGSGSAVANGARVPAQLTLFYLRRGRETWWQLLPVVNRRFGVGKASFFGPWTLPFVVVLVVLLWIGTLRLVLRELG